MAGLRETKLYESRHIRNKKIWGILMDRIKDRNKNCSFFRKAKTES